MQPRIPRGEIVRLLRDPSRMAWTPVHILFLGLSDDPADHALVRRAIDTAAAHGVCDHLAAWATAYAEIDRTGGDRASAGTVFRRSRPRRGRAARRRHRLRHPRAGRRSGAARRDRRRLSRACVRASPALAAEAARQLIWAEDWSQADTFADLLASGAVDDPAAEFVISVYLEAAHEALGPMLPAADWSLE